MAKKRKKAATRTPEERRLERERYDERTRLLEERIARGLARLQARGGES
jgi:hypothetical protein